MFEIKRYICEYFDNISGIILDDAYDIQKRNEYINFVKENNILFINSQDNDMNNLMCFPTIEYLMVPEDAENISSINNLTNLKGLIISGSFLGDIDFDRLVHIERLVIFGDSNVCFDKSRVKKLIELTIVGWEIKSPKEILQNLDLRFLKFESCKQLVTLDSINQLVNLKSLSCDYCPKLTNEGIKHMYQMNLEDLELISCNKIDEFDFLSSLTNLKKLSIYNSFTSTPNKTIPDLSFLEHINLDEYCCDLRIIDGNLKPLLKIKHAQTFKMYKNYNLKDKDLPKEFVLYRIDNNTAKSIKLSELPLGKEDPNIIWNE